MINGVSPFSETTVNLARGGSHALCHVRRQVFRAAAGVVWPAHRGLFFCALPKMMFGESG